VPAAEGVRVVNAAAKQHPDAHAHAFLFVHAFRLVHAYPHGHQGVRHGDSHANPDSIGHGHGHAVRQPHIIRGSVGYADLDRGDAADARTHVPE
jgi:hypothetical protein